MATQETPEETKVSDSGVVTVPAGIRQRLDIEPGDKLRWNTDDEGNLTVEVVRERYGAFEDFEPVPMGGDGGDTHNLAGHGADPAFREDS
jgi:antitoxin PrlF